jgi:hypothetical protein
MAHARALAGCRRFIAPLLVRGARRVALPLAFSLLGCAAAGPGSQAATATASTRARAATFGDDTARLPRYRSKRLSLSLPLPDGSAWRIDDHTSPALIATHAPTRSRVLVAVFRADEPVGRTQCEELARGAGYLADGPSRTLDDEIAVTQSTFDTRIRVALRPGSDSRQPLVGEVTAVGGFLRKCYVFDFSTEVGGADDEPALSARLAFARTRILGGLELQPFDAVPRLAPGGLEAPARLPAAEAPP